MFRIHRPLSNRPTGGKIPGPQRGMTVIELLVAVAVLLVLASAVVPLHHWDEKRRREKQLRISLQIMRGAIDQYHRLVEQGLVVQEDVDQMGYPLTLDELVEGVDVSDPNSTKAQVIRFLHAIPVDPFTEQADWGLRSYQDDWDSTSWGGENVYDVYSLSELVALDETYYSEW